MNEPLHPCTKYGAWVTECASSDCASHNIPELWIDAPVVIGQNGEIIELVDLLAAAVAATRSAINRYRDETTPGVVYETSCRHCQKV